MMAALERSESAQRRLVADASHELRTPLATLRTNIETLGRRDEIDPAEREQLVGDVTDELEEMTELVADVVELARLPGGRRRRSRGRRPGRARSRRGRALAAAGSGAALRGADLALAGTRRPPAAGAGDLQHARQRLQVEPRRDDGGDRGGRRPGRVRDHGPGFSEEDLPRVFDRFWRSDEARGKPGSGLGLAIVQRVAEEHGGTARAANAKGGGAWSASSSPPSAESQARFLGRSQAALRLAWLDLRRARRDREAKPKEW